MARVGRIIYFKELMMKNHILRTVSAVTIVFLAGQAPAHLCDNVFRQADKLIVKPETYNIVVKDKATFKIFLQNNMDRGIADISLIPASEAFDFTVNPKQMSIPQNQRTFFEVTMTPKPAVKSGTYTINFRLVGGKDQRLFKSFSMKMDDPGPDRKPTAAAQPAEAAQPAGAGQTAAAGEKSEQHPLVATVKPADARPEIDGQLTDATWKKAAVLSNFSPGSGNQAIYDTTALITFDASDLYLGILCNDDNEELLSDADTLEVILSPPQPRLPSYSIKVTALNVSTLKSIRADGTVGRWPASGISFAVAKAKRAWMLEIAIPFAALGAKAPKSPELWKLRIVRNKAGANAESSYWASDSTGANSTNGMGVVRLQP